MKLTLSLFITLATSSSAYPNECFLRCLFNTTDIDTFADCFSNCPQDNSSDEEIKDTDDAKDDDKGPRKSNHTAFEMDFANIESSVYPNECFLRCLFNTADIDTFADCFSNCPQDNSSDDKIEDTDYGKDDDKGPMKPKPPASEIEMDFANIEASVYPNELRHLLIVFLIVPRTIAATMK